MSLNARASFSVHERGSPREGKVTRIGVGGVSRGIFPNFGRNECIY